MRGGTTVGIDVRWLPGRGDGRCHERQLLDARFTIRLAAAPRRLLASWCVDFFRTAEVRRGSPVETITLERLVVENEALRRRVEALEAEMALRDVRDAEQSRRILKLERVLRELPLLVDIFDVASSRSVFKNRDLDALLGYTLGALAAMGPQPMLYKTVHPDDIPRVLEFLQGISRDRGDMEEVIVDYRVCRGDGAPGWFRAQLRPFERAVGAELATVPVSWSRGACR